MRINIHAGHNPDNMTACGAVGLIKESTEARKVVGEVIRLLKELGHNVYDCTVNDGTSQNDVLKKIVAKSNSNPCDLTVSIHFNSGRNDYNGDTRNGGVEAYVYSAKSEGYQYAVNLVNEITELGFRNRGVFVRPSLYVLAHTTAPSVLLECCFVDDKDDCKIYDYRTMAQAIVLALVGSLPQEKISTSKNPIYRVQLGAFSKKENALKLLKELENKGYSGFISKEER